MNDFNNALNIVLNTQPIVTASFAAIGLATVFALLWKILQPIFVYLTSSPAHMITVWCAVLIVVGSTFWGYHLQGDKGAFGGFGISASVLGGVLLAIYWLRKWIAWSWGS